MHFRCTDANISISQLEFYPKVLSNNDYYVLHILSVYIVYVSFQAQAYLLLQHWDSSSGLFITQMYIWWMIGEWLSDPRILSSKFWSTLDKYD